MWMWLTDLYGASVVCTEKVHRRTVFKYALFHIVVAASIEPLQIHALHEADRILRLGPTREALQIRPDVARVVSVSLSLRERAAANRLGEHAARQAEAVPVERLGHETDVWAP